MWLRRGVEARPRSRPHPALHRLVAVAAALLVVLPSAFSAFATGIVDARGRGVTAGDTARIVSIGGATTEILYALGLEKKVAAVDSTSLFPERALREKPNLGYMRQLSAEGVLGLNPTLVLASEASGPKETMAVLTAASVPMVLVPERYTGEGVVEKVNLVAAATGADKQGACLASAIGRDLEALANIRARVERPLRVLFLLSFMNDRPMVAGHGTAADGIIKLAGAANAIDGYDGYKILTDEAVSAINPDVVLTMQRAGAELSAADVFGRPAFQLTQAARDGRFVSMEGLYLLGFGPRTARAARDLAATLYPDLAAGALPSEAQGAQGAPPAGPCP